MRLCQHTHTHLQVQLPVHGQGTKQQRIHVCRVCRVRPTTNIERCTHRLCLARGLHTRHALGGGGVMEAAGTAAQAACRGARQLTWQAPVADAAPDAAASVQLICSAQGLSDAQSVAAGKQRRHSRMHPAAASQPDPAGQIGCQRSCPGRPPALPGHTVQRTCGGARGSCGGRAHTHARTQGGRGITLMHLQCTAGRPHARTNAHTHLARSLASLAGGVRPSMTNTGRQP
jgi:hypothetical protein